MVKKNIYLLLILVVIFIFNIIEVIISNIVDTYYYSGFGIVPAIIISFLSFNWCIEHAKFYKIELPRGSALLTALLAPIGAVVYFFRGFGFKEGMRKTFKAIGFFLVLLIIGGYGVLVAENFTVEKSVQKVETNKGIEAFDNGDYETAFNELEELAILDNADAQFRLARMYGNGQGAEQNYKEAAYWYTKAAEQDNVTAQYLLGVAYKYGRGVDVNIEKAKYWLRKAGENGSVEANEVLKKL